MATVGVMSRGRGGRYVAWPWWASRHIAAVGVVALHFVLRALSLRGHSGCCVAVVFVAWL